MPETQTSSLPEHVTDSASPPVPPRSNNSLGIQDLPTELLIDVFTEVDRLEAWSPYGRAQGRALPKLMAVCPRWQQICIDVPQFWRYIDAIEPVSHVALLLKRSSGCTIDVRIFYRNISKEKSIDEEAVDLVLQHAARFRSLYVNVFVRDLNLYIIPWLASGPGFPALESLTITPMEHSYNNVRRIIDCGLSRVNQPRLHTLVLKQIYVPPPRQFWRSLRVLKMHDHPTMLSDPVLPFAVKDFVAVLGYNAALEELYLWCSRRRVPEDFPIVADEPLDYHSHRGAPRALIGLPKLQVFSIHARHALITELLLHLVLSEDIPCVDIRASVPPSLIPQRPFTDLLPTHFHFLIRRMEEGVSYRYGYQYWTEFRAPPNTPPDVDLAREFTSIAFRVESEPGPPRAETELHGLNYLVEALGWMAVRRLVLSFSIAYAPVPEELSAYEHFLDAFPALEQLELRGPIASRLNMFTALGQSGNGDAPHVEEPRCPHLRVLDVRARCYVATEARQVLEAVLQCARVRAEGKVPLERLVLKIWVEPRYDSEEPEEEPDSDDLQTVTDEIVSQIKGYVGRVECTLPA